MCVTSRVLSCDACVDALSVAGSTAAIELGQAADLHPGSPRARPECVLLDAFAVCGCVECSQHHVDCEDGRPISVRGLPVVLLDGLFRVQVR